MKRLLILALNILTMFIGLVLPSIAQQQILIYENDGTLDVIFEDQVDSIMWSNYDVDSVWHNDVVTQVIYTADSIYQIPIANIDSVSFIIPETVYQPGVKELDKEFKSYVVSVDSLTIRVSSAIPNNLLPQKGDKIVTTVMDDIFPIGFAGEVIGVVPSGATTDIICQAVALEDIFVEFYSGSYHESADSESTKRKAPHNLDDDPPIWHYYEYRKYISWTQDLGLPYTQSRNFSFGIREKLETSLTSKIKGYGFIYTSFKRGTQIKLHVEGTHTIENYVCLEGILNWNKDFRLVNFKWPVVPLVDSYLSLGLFFRVNCEIGSNLTSTLEYKSLTDISYNSRQYDEPIVKNKITPKVSNTTGSTFMKGDLTVGVFAEIGFDFIHTGIADLVNANVRGEFGAQLKGDISVTKKEVEEASKNTNLYEKLRDNSIDLYRYFGLSANLSFWNHKVLCNYSGKGNIGFDVRSLIKSYNLAPKFTKTKARLTLHSLRMSSIIGNHRIINGRKNIPSVDAGFWVKDENGKTIVKKDTIHNYSSGIPMLMSYRVNDIPECKELTIYPYIKWMGLDILASPSCKVNKTIVCPDEYHPHEVDLGLPSGIRWSCCNVGASAPEEFGGYYAWGETYEKSSYTWDTYQWSGDNKYSINKYCINEDYGPVDGKSVLEPQDDVANVKWKNYWRMPTWEEQNELRDNCIWEWTEVNDVPGMMVSSKINGLSIFLPAAGYKRNSSISDSQSYGYYQSASLDQNVSDDSYYFYFDKYGHYWKDFSTEVGRDVGFSVRPIRQFVTEPVPIEPIEPNDTIPGKKRVIRSINDDGEEPEDRGKYVSKDKDDGDFPAVDDYMKLIGSFKWIWTEQNDVPGVLFIGSEGQKVFMPAAGYISDGELYNLGIEALYWTQSPEEIFHADEDNVELKEIPLEGILLPVRRFLQTHKLIKVDPNLIDFQHVSVGASKTKQFLVRNVGTAKITFKIENTHGVFSIPSSGNSYSLDIGQSRSFDVTYTPTSSECDIAEVGIISDAENGIQRICLLGNICPDDNHPHEVDLGLPSGIRWSCCNLGASNPVDCGNYYTWDKTNKNSIRENHTLQDSVNSEDQNNDSTSFDLAQDLWGSDWKVPTKSQIEELIDTCTITWFNGGIVKGPNGNILFLPAAGYKTESDLKGIGTESHFWSSTLDENSESEAYSLRIVNNEWDCDVHGPLDYEYSVRPVCVFVPPISEGESYAVYNSGTLTFYHDQSKGSREGTVYELNTGKNKPGWSGHSYDIRKVMFDDSFANARPTTTYRWFFNFTNLTTIEGIENLNTSRVTNMESMFQYCYELNSLDLSNLNTSRVTDMKYMFQYCYELNSLDLSNFNTEKVTDMSSMFYYCCALTSLDVSKFNTEKVTSMGGMFYYCYGLTSLDVSNFNTEKVTNMEAMFQSCYSIKTLDVSNFNLASCEKSKLMFRNCRGLNTLAVSSTMENLDESACRDVGYYAPCTIIAPDGFNFGVDTSGESFRWKSGYFKLGNSVGICPDQHHPHMIDLGLPSGKKWACCNVGASSPEKYGGFYAWGETSEKNVYDWSTYIYCDGSWETCYDIGDDISSTNYDVAHVKWKGSWRMPSIDQMYELFDNCNFNWTTQNGLFGLLFTGKNGGTIFVPAAGTGNKYESDPGPNFVGEYGEYWSSSLYPGYVNLAYGFGFVHDHTSYELGIEEWYGSRDVGSSVRPVCP